MKKLTLCLILFLTWIGQATAERISEQEAYNIAQQFFATNKRLAKGTHTATSLQLAHTSTSYYAFNRGERAGFVLVATEDCFSKEILGYADKGTFDIDNLPPNMRWWLGEYDRALEAKKRTSNQRQKVITGTKQKVARAERAEINPLLSCTWGQGEPYNAMCPIYEGTQCVTGCTATAIAQLLYYNKYPETGEGELEYEWKVNDISQGTLSSNFSQHIYNYNAMTDTYDNSSSQESRDAVAQLMYDAGIASQMGYGPYESSAYTHNAAYGLVHYFKYDKSTIPLSRDYYEDGEWIDMMYESLASFYPIYYTGYQEAGGHAFVCDGYRDGYFHFNWGWDGNQNGYFLINNMGYNLHQEAMFNLHPAQANSEYTVLMYCENDFTFNRVENSHAIFSGGFYNYSLTTQHLTLGLKVVNSDNSITWVESYNTDNLDHYYGYKTLTVNLSGFPSTDGEYLVYPAYRDNATGTWYEMRTKTSSDKRYLIANVSGNNITFSTPEETAPEEGTLTFTKLNEPEIIAEKEFSVQFRITNTGEDFVDDITLHLLSEGTYNSFSKSNPISVNLPTGNSTEVTFSIMAPITAGNYDLVIANSNNMVISNRYTITVNENSESTILSLSSLKIENANNVPIDNINVSAQISCERGAYNGSIGFAMFTEDLATNLGLVYQEFSIAANETKEVSYTGTFKDIEEGKKYYLVTVYLADDHWQILGDGQFFTIAKEPEIPAAISIADALTAAANTNVCVEAQAVALSTSGAVLADETGFIYYYGTPDFKMGDAVNVVGTVTAYGGFNQFKKESSTVTVGGNTAVNHPTPTEIDGAALDAWITAPAHQYVTITGKLSINGNYYNLNVEGATTGVGSLVSPTAELLEGVADGNNITVTGYAAYVSGSKYMNIVVTDIEVNNTVELEDPTNTPETAYTVEQAIELINKSDVYDLNKKVYTKGVIVGTPSINTLFGNASYNIQTAGGTSTLKVYHGYFLENAKFTTEEQIKEGDEVIVYGQLTLYGETYEINSGNYIYSLESKEEEPDTPEEPETPTVITVAKALAAEANTNVCVEAQAVALSTSGAVLADATGFIYYYGTPDFKMGDAVNVVGTVTAYGGFNQFKKETSTVTVGGNTAVNHPTPTEIDGAALDAWLAAPVHQYVTITGKLSISGNYYNLNVEGATTGVGSLVSPTAELLEGVAEGSNITVTGYAAYTSGSKYMNIVVTAIEVNVVVELKDPSNTPETAYTAAEAKLLIDSSDEYDLSKEVFVKGVINEVTEITTEFGNATFVIEDAFTIFRCRDIDGEKFTDVNALAAGDEIVVKGFLKLYNGTYELTDGQLVSVKKAIVDGINGVQLNTPEDKAYDLTGRVAKKNAKGIVIINGKKVVK